MLLHLGVVALVLALASLVLTAAGAVVAALWFAVQPVHVEVVANVVGRAELLAAAGYLVAVLAYLRIGDDAADAPRGARSVALVLAVLAGAAVAFGAKEHALTLPAVLVLADLVALARARRGRGARACAGTPCCSAVCSRSPSATSPRAPTPWAARSRRASRPRDWRARRCGGARSSWRPRCWSGSNG